MPSTANERWTAHLPSAMRIMVVLAVAVVAIGCFAVMNDSSEAATYHGDCGTDLKWKFSDSTNKLTITGTGPMYDYSSGGAPWSPYNVKYVELGSGITTIGNNAFYECKYLRSITIPEGVTSIGTYAFSEASVLTTVTIPSTVTEIGAYAFQYCTYLNSVSIPNGVTAIKNGTFRGCTNLQSISIPDSVVTINDSAFVYCVSLKSVDIPKNVNSLPGSAFNGCKSLTSINVAADNPHFYSVDGVPFMTSPNSIVKYPEGRTGPYTIPDGVKGFATAFQNATRLTSIVIPDSVDNIQASAFAGCSSLTSVTLPNSIVILRDSTFENCSSLKSIVIPGSVTQILNSVFENCASLTSVTIPSGVTSIGDNAFDGCASLKTLTIPDSVTSIGSSAFSNCVSLTSITIPSGVTTIGEYAFKGCASLTSVTIPSGVTTIGGYAFNGCASLTSITIPSGVTSIGAYAFNGCASLTSVTIPNVTNISYSVFSGCTSLKSITIPDSVTVIGENAFYRCVSLEKVTLSKNVTSIDPSAFRNCSSLTAFVVDGDNPDYSSVGGVLIHKATNTLMQYPVGKTDATYTVPDTVTSIGVYAFATNPHLTKITIPESVVVIGQNAFAECKKLASVELPDTITEIPGGAFFKCTSLTSISLPDSVVVIGLSAFQMSGLTQITMPAVAMIGGYAFYGCTKLVDLEIGKKVEIIGESAFAESAITSAIIPNSVTHIGDNAFYKCVSLTTVYIPGSVTSIGDYAFDGCRNLESIEVSGANEQYSSEDGVLFYMDKTVLVLYPAAKTGDRYEIPDTVETLASNAFFGCTNLESIVIPSSVKKIQSGNFNLCNSLSSIEVHVANANYASVDGVLYDADKKTLLVYPANKTDSELVLPETVVMIDGTLNKHIEKIVLPATYVGDISSNFFYVCTGLRSIEVDPNNPWYTAEDGVLFDKEKTTLVAYPASRTDSTYTIPDSVKSLSVAAFVFCTDLEKLVVPAGLISIMDINFIDCGSLESIEVNSANPVYASDDGILFNKDKTELLVYPAGKRGDTYTLPSNVTVNSQSFYGSKHLTAIEVSSDNPYYSSVEGMLCDKAGRTLLVCPAGLKSVTVPVTIQVIEKFAFTGDKLRYVTIEGGGNALTTVRPNAFSSDSLREITIDEGREVIFERGSIGVLLNNNQPRSIYISAPEGFVVNPNAVDIFTDIVYGDAPSDGKKFPVWGYILIGVAGVIVLAGAAFVLIKKKG